MNVWHRGAGAERRPGQRDARGDRIAERDICGGQIEERLDRGQVEPPRRFSSLSHRVKLRYPRSYSPSRLPCL